MRHVRGVRIAQHHHAQRIADEEQRNARLVQQPGHRKIVSGERGDLFAARFHRANGFGGYFGFSHGSQMHRKPEFDKGNLLG